MGEVEKAAEGLVKALESSMDYDARSCVHQLSRPPELVTNSEGTSFLLFDCLLCGCAISLRLNAEGVVDGEFVVPPALKCA